jgi:hypothetical protein
MRFNLSIPAMAIFILTLGATAAVSEEETQTQCLDRVKNEFSTGLQSCMLNSEHNKLACEYIVHLGLCVQTYYCSGSLGAEQIFGACRENLPMPEEF